MTRVRPWQRLVGIAIMGAAASHCARTAPLACSTRASIAPPAGTAFDAAQVPAVSRDGSRVVVTAVGPDRVPRLWVQSLRESTVSVVPGTEGAAFPFWSPDDTALGFFADGRLKRAVLPSGPVTVLGDAKDGHGGSWSAGGVIIFAAGEPRAVRSVPAEGGAVRQLTNLDHDADTSEAWPMFLADGEHFVYSSEHLRLGPQIVLGSLRSTERNSLLPATSSPAFVGPDFMLFAGGDVLLRTRFDRRILEVAPPPHLVAQAVARGAAGLAQFGASADGSVVAYGRADREIVWLDADGRETPAAPVAGASRHPSLSPSGDEILVSLGAPWLGNGGGVYDAYRRQTDQWRRVAEGQGNSRRPLWSPDGTEIIFTTAEGPAALIRAARADGSGTTRTLFEERAGAYAAAVSGARGLLAVVEQPDGAGTSWNLRVLSLSAGGGLEAATAWRRQVAWSEYAPAFSPDGLRLAFVSEQSGAAEVFVSDLAGQAGPAAVSAHGGTFPVWSRDGRTLFYRSPAGLIAVATDGAPSGWTARERVLFQAADLLARSYDPEDFDVAVEGTSLLMLKTPRAGRPPRVLTVAACR